MTCFENYFELNPKLFKIRGDEPVPSDDWTLSHETSLGRIIHAEGSLCVNCSEVYDKLRNYFWANVVPSNEFKKISHSCYDIRDAVSFNCTQCGKIVKTLIYLALFAV